MKITKEKDQPKKKKARKNKRGKLSAGNEEIERTNDIRRKSVAAEFFSIGIFSRKCYTHTQIHVRM